MTATHVGSGYRLGFTTLRNETIVDDLPVTGELPPWLTGTLVRNGPADFDGGRRPFRHWFDGQAMLHRFSFAEGRVGYANAFLDTPSLRSLRDRGRIGYSEFATDPCAGLFGRFFSRFHRHGTPNNAVNVAELDGEPFALGEVPVRVWFDRDTLRTVGVEGYDDALDGALTTAHPHLDRSSGDLVNFVLKFSRSSEFCVYRQSGSHGARRLVGKVATERPGYMHSFGITTNYVVLAMYPLVVNPLSFLIKGRPFIENYRWTPELGTVFHVLRLSDGELVGSYRTEPCFAFHHINAREEDGALLVDLCAFSDAKIIDALYLDRLRDGQRVPRGIPTRFRIDLAGGSVEQRPLSTASLELPRIDYRRNGLAYRYAFGVGSRDEADDDFLNQLVRVDVESGDTAYWSQPGCYPGEPVFVAEPGTEDEDRGVLLSVVLDAEAGHSMLVILDAGTFTELARAEVPHVVPFGFHGQFSSAH